MSFPVTGQPMPKAEATFATHLLAPIVDIRSLSESNHPINDAVVSGKQEGAWVITKAANGDLSVAVAAGPLPTDKWFPANVGSKVSPV